MWKIWVIVWSTLIAWATMLWVKWCSDEQIEISRVLVERVIDNVNVIWKKNSTVVENEKPKPYSVTYRPPIDRRTDKERLCKSTICEYVLSWDWGINFLYESWYTKKIVNRAIKNCNECY